MLHELLLALSGHPSPLLSQNSNHPLVSKLSPSEKDLLRSLARLGSAQAELNVRISHVVSSSTSTVCRAVANSIARAHLSAFQKKIIDVEKGILSKDASYVGAYEIVPLSGVVRAFDGWERILDWLLDLVLYIQVSSGRDDVKGTGKRSGAQLINRLRQESQTGYVEIERIALALGKEAESTWLRQVTTWVLYGKLPSIGAADFFIHRSDDQQTNYEIRRDLVPGFVSSATSSSILSIGKSINHIRSHGAASGGANANRGEIETSLLQKHLSYLSTLQYPLSTTALSAAILAIRSSLSQNALSSLLPLADVMQLLHILRKYFLLEDGEFVIALVTAADDCSSARHRQVHSSKEINRLGGLMINAGEVSATLAKTWTSIAPLQDSEDEETNEVFERARDLLELSIRKVGPRPDHNSSSTIEPLFEDVLFAIPTRLSINVSSPLDLFLTPASIDIYSDIHAYLLAIRRSHFHLTQLWSLSSLRRCQRHQSDHEVSPGNTARKVIRERQLRGTWAAISAVISFLTELSEYLQGEVVASSWGTFRRWLVPSSLGHSTSSFQPSRPGSSGHSNPTDHVTAPTASSVETDNDSSLSPRDPETLAHAHETFLKALIHSLLLTDGAFTRQLRLLVTRVDHLVALLTRLATILETYSPQLDDGHDSGGESASAVDHVLREEKDILHTLSTVRTSVQSGLADVLKRLRVLDTERLDQSVDSLFADVDYAGGRADSGNTQNADGGAGFKPWRSPGVYRLLVKIDGAGTMDIG